MTATAPPRNVRDSNPGNIVAGAKWQGLMAPGDMSAAQLAEKHFCVFAAPKWGFRAIARVLIAYQTNDNDRSIRQVISRWAPATENDTQVYIAHVVELTGFSPDAPLNFHTYEHCAPVTKAIATHESGGWMFDDRDLTSGMILAGVEPPPPTVASSRTYQGAAGAGAATTIVAVSQAIQQAQPAVDVLKQFASIAPWIAVAVLVAAIGYIIYARYDDHVRNAR